MNLRKQGLLARLMKPADDGDLPGVTTSSEDLDIPDGADRGDDFQPTGEDDDHRELQRKAAKLDKADKTETPPKTEGKKAEGEADGKKTEGETTTEGKKTEGENAEGKGKKGVIPLERHEAVLKRERDARERVEAQLKQYQGGDKVAKANTDVAKLEEKLTDLDTQYAKALADGDTRKAAELMQNIRKIEREVVETRANFRIEAVRTQAVEMARYEAVVERIEEAYPQLNPQHENYDSDLDEDVADLMETYQRRGMPPAKALQRAVEKLVKPASAKQEDATTTTPRVTKEEAAATAERLAAERKANATKTAADANRRQPPSTDKVGQNSDKMGGGLNARDVVQLPYEEFRKLGEADLAKLRGDEL